MGNGPRSHSGPGSLEQMQFSQAKARQGSAPFTTEDIQASASTRSSAACCPPSRWTLYLQQLQQGSGVPVTRGVEEQDVYFRPTETGRNGWNIPSALPPRPFQSFPQNLTLVGSLQERQGPLTTISPASGYRFHHRNTI